MTVLSEATGCFCLMTECRVNTKAGPFLWNVGFFWVVTLGPELITLDIIFLELCYILRLFVHSLSNPHCSLSFTEVYLYHDLTVLLSFSNSLLFFNNGNFHYKFLAHLISFWHLPWRTNSNTVVNAIPLFPQLIREESALQKTPLGKC